MPVAADKLPQMTSPADTAPRARGCILTVDEMPGLYGMAVGRALRQNPRTARAKIAMHTGLDEAQVRAGFSGYDAFVPKASHPRLLGERVDSLLRGQAV